MTSSANAVTFLTQRPRTLPIRRIVSGIVLAALLIGLVALQQSGFQRATHITGYVLFTAILFLASLQLRKRFPGLPLGRMSTWLQLHLDVAYVSIVLFFLHIGFRVPSGNLEIVLAALFLIVAGSGVYGLFITRTIPAKLAAIPEEVVYERIPALRREIIGEAREIILRAADSTVIAELYRSKLAGFLESPRSWYYFRPNGNRRREIVAAMRDLHRYLSPERRRDCERLEQLVCRKDNLDYHAALQGRLKLWMFGHIGFTYGLIAAGFVHGILVHAFHGGNR